MDLIDPCSYMRDDYVHWVVEILEDKAIHRGKVGAWTKGHRVAYATNDPKILELIRAYKVFTDDLYEILNAVYDLNALFP